MEYIDELYHSGRKGMKWGENIFTDEDRKRGQDVRLKQKGQRVREQQKQERLDKQKREMLNKVMAEKQRREGHGGQNVVNPPTSKPNYVTTEDMEDRNANLAAQKENLLSNVDEFKTLVAVKGDKSVDDYDTDMREKYANNIDYDKIKNNLEVTNKYSSNSLRDRDGYIEKELDSLSNKLDAKLKELEKKYSIVKPPEDKDYEKKLKDIKLRFENIKADARINYERAFNDVMGPRKDSNEISPIGFIKYTTSKKSEKKDNKDHETEVAENGANPLIVPTPYMPIVIPKNHVKHSVINAADKILANRAEQIGEDELYHHGILGMKWGVRKYQNEDGSLTPEGERRYRSLSKGEKLGKMNSTQNARTGNTIGFTAGGIVGAPIGILAGKGLSNKENKRLSDLSDKEAEKEEKYVKEGMRSSYKASRTVGHGLLGYIGGSAVGSALGTIGGLALMSATGDPRTAAGAIYAGAGLGSIGGMALGAVRGYKTADSKFEERYDKWNNDPNFAYRKRTKEELAEYDREHANQ